MANNLIHLNLIDQEMHLHINSCIDNYVMVYLTVPDDIIFRLYLYSYDKVKRKRSHVCVPDHFLKASGYSDAWSDIVLSTGLADIFGIERQDYKIDVSEALDSAYVCLILVGKYVLSKPKTYKKENASFWHTVDQALHSYEIDKKSKVSLDDKIIIADYLKLDFHYDSSSCPRWLTHRKIISEDEIVSDGRKEEITDIIKKMVLSFDSLTDLDKLTPEKKKSESYRDTTGKKRNFIRFPSYFAPLIRASYVSVHDFPYLPNRHVYRDYKKYEEIYHTNLGIDEKAYIYLQRIIRYKDYIRNIKKNTNNSDNDFLKKYFSVLYDTFDSIRKEDPTGEVKYYRCMNEKQFNLMEIKEYYYLTEEIYGYYLFRREAQLIKGYKDDLDSLSHEERRLLKQALKDIFLCCPGVFTRIQAAEEAIKFIFVDSSELIVLEACKKYDDEGEQIAGYNRDVKKQNSLELRKITEKFSYEHFAENEERAITNLLMKIFPEKEKSPIEEVILRKLKERINIFEDQTGMMNYYEKCFDEYYFCHNKIGCHENISDENDNLEKDEDSYKNILCWVIKKSVGDKWYRFSELVDSREK